MSPELRAGNASLRADGDETLEAVQRAAAVAGQFLPVDADGGMTVRELLQRRDGGPLEARYGRLRDRVLAAGMNGLSLGSEAVKDVAGYDLRRPADGQRARRLGRLPPGAAARAARAAARARRRCVRARRGAARRPGRARRARGARALGLLAIAEDCGADEQGRRRGHVERCVAEAGAELEEIDEARWLAICAGLPTTGMRMAGAMHASCRRTRGRGRTTRAGGSRSSSPPHARPSHRRARPLRRVPRSSPPSSERPARDRPRPHRRAARALRRARPPVRVVRALPARLPHLRPAGGGVRRPARPHPHHAAARRRRSRSVEDARGPLDRCLGCRACETACPSDVQYGELLEIARDGGAQTPSLQVRTLLSLVRRPRLLSLALRAGRPLARFVPGAAGRSGRALDGHEDVNWECRNPGGPTAVVLRGCVMREAFGGVQQAAVDALGRPATTSSPAPSRAAAARCTCTTASSRPARRCASSCSRAFPRSDPRLDRSRLRRRAARARRARARPQRGARARSGAAAGQRRRPGRGLRRLPPAARPGRARGAARAVARRRLRAGRAGRQRALLRRGRRLRVHAARALAAARPEPRRGDPRERRRIVSCGNPGCALQLRGALREAGLDVRVAHPAELAAEATGVGL